MREVKSSTGSHFVGYVRNVESEAQMARANAYSDAISHISSTPIIVMSAEGLIINCSESCCERFAWSREELIGQNISMLMPESTAKNHDEYLRKYRRGCSCMARMSPGARAASSTRSDALALARVTSRYSQSPCMSATSTLTGCRPSSLDT